MKGYAPGWQVRCTKCQRTRSASGVGIVRVGAWTWKNFTPGWCSSCQWLRFLAVERKPVPAQSASA